MVQDHLFSVILPAAGNGARFGGGDKLLTMIGGQSVLQRSVGLFAGRAEVGQIILVTGTERFDFYREHLRSLAVELTFVAGGRERWESVLFGLRAVKSGVSYAAVHDAARPLTPRAVIDAAFVAAVRVGGAVPCVAEPATLKRATAEGMVEATVDRRGLFQAQTPQCFEFAVLRSAYEELAACEALAGITDDAQVFERIGRKVAITVGSVRNLKITTAEDVALAEALAETINR